MHVVFVCADKTVAAAAARILLDTGVEIETIDHPDLPHTPHIDAVLVWHEDLRRMTRPGRRRLLGIAGGAPLIDVMEIDAVATMTERTLLADGIVFLDSNLKRLVEIVHLTRAGYMLVPRELTPERLAACFGGRSSPRLNDVDAEILAGLAEGLSDRQISARMHVNEMTAKRLVHRLMRKLGVKTRTRAAVYVRLLTRLREALSEDD